VATAKEANVRAERGVAVGRDRETRERKRERWDRHW
jgi:hypothetical protein